MPKMQWENDALAALGKVPFFFRPLARRKIEEGIRKSGREKVTIAE